MSIVITRARARDAAGIEEVKYHGWCNAYPNRRHNITLEDIRLKPWGSPERLANLRQRIRAFGPTTHGWVAKERGQVIGWCAAEKKWDHGYIDELYILRRYYGRGVGSALLECALAWLEHDRPVKLVVTIYNMRAIHFYRKHDFELGEAYVFPEPTFPNGKRMPSREMIRPVTVHVPLTPSGAELVF